MKHLKIFCLLALACFATITIAFAQAARAVCHAQRSGEKN